MGVELAEGVEHDVIPGGHRPAIQRGVVLHVKLPAFALCLSVSARLGPVVLPTTLSTLSTALAMEEGAHPPEEH